MYNWKKSIVCLLVPILFQLGNAISFLIHKVLEKMDEISQYKLDKAILFDIRREDWLLLSILAW